jgi:hypothetical protein
MIRAKRLFLSAVCAAAPLCAADEVFPQAPGIVIDHSFASSGLYIGSPSLCVLPDGGLLASHDFFGPKSGRSGMPKGRIFRSSDRGKTWAQIAEIDGFFWQNLFVRKGVVHAIGTDREHGNLVIRRSVDGGKTWTDPRDADHGLIRTGAWHTAPVPVVTHGGRIWRAVEDAESGIKWGSRYRARMLSAPLDTDLLKAANWTLSNPLARDASWLMNGFGGWLEGNAVIDPAGNVLNILRVETSRLPEKAALVRVSADGKSATFDPMKDFIDFPGGAKKFTIRKDPEGGGYWSLANIAGGGTGRPADIRNTLALVHSRDLRAWETRCILLHHPDVAKHGFQYADWQFDGDDLIAVCRTAWDDAEGQAHNKHDANYLTFHRWRNFRSLTRKNDVPGALGIP